jgi:hypothetical protein
MALPYWSVRLIVADPDASRIRVEKTHQGVRSIWLGRRALDPEEEPTSVVFELEARDAQEARVLGQHILGDMRRRAGLPVKESPIIWVARLADGGESSLRFLQYAEEVVTEDEGPYELAVVAAQTHLEIQVRVLVEMAASESDSPILKAVTAKQARWAPHERWLKPILEALFEIKMTDCNAWEDYEAHVTRRNAVVHKGQTIDVTSAKASVDAVLAVWLWLNRAASEHAG